MKKFLFVLLMLILAVFLIAAAPMQEAQPDYDTWPVGVENIALLLFGSFAMPGINYLKNKLGWSGKSALWLAFIVSYVVAVIAMYASGSLVDVAFNPESVASNGMIVFGIATAVFKLWPQSS